MDSVLVFSASPEFADAALAELRQVAPGARLVRWLEPGTGLLAGNFRFAELASLLDCSLSLFVRHLFPVTVRLPLKRVDREVTSLASVAESLLPDLEVGLTFSVQTRFGEKAKVAYPRKEAMDALIAPIKAAGFAIDVRAPEQVVSAYFDGEELLLGVSRVEYNLSAWSGGVHRFAWEDSQISRAEFKLLEAIDVFSLKFPNGGRALDLGASPGGWTRVLRQRGLSVVAVDPGELHESLARDKRVDHYCGTVQNFVKECQSGKRKGQPLFDLIVNDMRMEPRESVAMTELAARFLQPEGQVVMTLKLPGRRATEAAGRGMVMLADKFDIYGARQLFHNRNEVTVVVRPPAPRP